MAANLLFRRSQRPETPKDSSYNLDSTNEIIEDTPEQVSRIRTKKLSSTDGESSINFSSDKSYRSQVLDSDESEEDGNPKDLHRDLTDDDSDDDIPLVNKGKLAVISSDSEEQESGDEEDGEGRFQTFSSEKVSIEDSFVELSFNSGKTGHRRPFNFIGNSNLLTILPHLVSMFLECICNLYASCF